MLRVSCLRVAVATLIITLSAECAWVLSGRYLDGWLWDLYSPAIGVTIALSGGPHDVSAPIGAIALTVQTFAMLYPVVLAVFVVSRLLRAKAKSQ